jgi:hypothetical protein
MTEILESLNVVRKKIGYESFIFLVMSFVTLTFGDKLGKDAPEVLRNSVPILAGGLFFIGIIIALLKLFAVFFSNRPARGLIDGLAAGIMAGVIGGYFGFGYHGGSNSIDSPFFRMALCVLFATPIGGILGLFIDLFHPDRPIQWKKYLGIAILVFSSTIVVVGYGIIQFVPQLKDGITLGDLQLLFEIFLLIISGLTAYSFGWPFKKIRIRYCTLFASIALARVYTLIIPVRDPLQEGYRLYQRRFLYNPSDIHDISGKIDLAFTIVTLMVWTLVTYALFFKDHRFYRLLNSRNKS